MTTAITSPAAHGARPADTPRGLLGVRLRSGRWRTAVTLSAAAVVAATLCLVAVSDLQARTEVRAQAASVVSAEHRLSAAREQLVRAERRLSRARERRASVTASFDAAQSTLTATEAALARDEAGVFSQGVDLGALDTCLGSVEQALNQLAVGQTAGGLASLRASSPSCSALDGTG